LWAGFLTCRPSSWPLKKFAAYLLFCGACFAIFVFYYAYAIMRNFPQVSGEDILFLKEMAKLRFSPALIEYGRHLLKFLYTYCFTFPLFPLAACSCFILLFKGSAEHKKNAMLFLSWAVGVGIVAVGMVSLDQEAARLLNRLPLEIDFIRGTRLWILIAIVVCFYALRTLGQKIPCPRIIIPLRVTALIIFMVFLYQNSSHPLAATVLGQGGITWERGENHRVLIEAVKQYTPPGAAILFNTRDSAIRYAALRSMPYNSKDGALFFLARGVDALRQWQFWREILSANSPAMLRACGIPYIIFGDPSQFQEISNHFNILWQNERYMLVKNPEVE
jgi:hypothetical protein